MVFLETHKGSVIISFGIAVPVFTTNFNLLSIAFQLLIAVVNLFVESLDCRLVLALAVDKVLSGHISCCQESTEDILYILYCILLPDLEYRSLVECHKGINIFQQKRKFAEYIVPALDAALFPDPGVFVGIGFDLGAVYVGVVQIHIELTKNTAVDIVEDILHTAAKLIVNEITYGHVAGSIHFIQHPEEANVCFAQFLDKTHRAISKLHERKQYDL